MTEYTHFVLATQDNKECRVAYTDIAPYAWWNRAYGRASDMPPKTIAYTPKTDWPIHTIELPSLIIHEFMKIFNGLVTIGQAHAHLPLLLEEAGYTILQWKRCLTRYGFVQTEKRTRDEKDEEDMGVVAPSKKKGRKTEPVLNPMEEKARAVGTALGKLIRADHPEFASFFNGDQKELKLQFIAPYNLSGAVPSYELDVPGIGTVLLVEYWHDLDRTSQMVMDMAVAEALHPRAIIHSLGYGTYTDWFPRRLDFARSAPAVSAGFKVSDWPSNRTDGINPEYPRDEVFALKYTVCYKPADPPKRKGR